MTLFLACVMSVLFTSTVLADDKTDKMAKKEAHHTKMVERIVKKLDLDDGRAFEVTKILNESNAAKKALVKKRGEEAKALKQATKEKLEAVLTPEELAKFKEIRKKAHKKMNRKIKEGNKERKNKKQKTDNG